MITYTQPLHIYSGSLVGSDYVLNVPDFNPKLGVLTQISLQFSGSLYDEALFENGAPEGGVFTAQNTAGLLAGGFIPARNFSLASGVFTIAAGAARAVSTTSVADFTGVLTGAALGDYTTGLPPGFEAVLVYFGFHIIDGAGNPVAASDGESIFSGQVVESYTYDAVSVAEPATLELVAAGLLAQAWLTRRRRRHTQPDAMRRSATNAAYSRI